MRTVDRRTSGLAAALTLLLAAAPAAAQAPRLPDRAFDRDCMDDYGRDLCDAATWAGIVDSFGVPPAEDLAAEGWRGVRVFTVNGYSHDMPMVSVLAREFDRLALPQDGELEVRGPARGDQPARSMTRSSWPGAWFAGLELRRLAEAAPERQSEAGPPPVASPDSITICSHAWLTVTESLGDGRVTRRVRNACGEDPVMRVAFRFSEMALNGFPHCNHLDPAHHRNESTRLESCLLVEGEDLVAGAEVLSILQGPPFRRVREIDAEAFAALVADDFRLSWGDAPVATGPAAVAAFVEEARRDRGVWLWPQRSAGRPGEVEVRGVAERSEGEAVLQAPFRQVWRRDGGAWRLRRFEVEPFTAAP